MDAMDQRRAPWQQIDDTRKNALKIRVSASNKEKKHTHLEYIKECLSVGEMGGGDVVKMLEVLPPWEMRHPAIHMLRLRYRAYERNENLPRCQVS